MLPELRFRAGRLDASARAIDHILDTGRLWRNLLGPRSENHRIQCQLSKDRVESIQKDGP